LLNSLASDDCWSFPVFSKCFCARESLIFIWIKLKFQFDSLRFQSLYVIGLEIHCLPVTIKGSRLFDFSVVPQSHLIVQRSQCLLNVKYSLDQYSKLIVLYSFLAFIKKNKKRNPIAFLFLFLGVK
jgi:hypothetical protein